MTLFQIFKSVTQKSTNYATSADFCSLFSTGKTSLYQLSYFLTADRQTAEQCFLSALDDCVENDSVFRESVLPFSRRTIVKNAVRMLYPQPSLYRPKPAPAKLAAGEDLLAMPMQNARMARVLELPDFERFVFVLSILERYPVCESATLLGCSAHEIDGGRIRALQQITESSAGSQIRRHVRVLVAKDSSLAEIQAFDMDLLDDWNEPRTDGRLE